MSTAPPQCSVFAGTRLWDESALELLVRVDTTAHAAPLLPFRGTDEVLLTGRRRDAAAGERERSGLARRRGGRNGAVQGAGHIVEICGPSGSGKTACCLHAVSECVMPRELGGHGGGALIVDCDGKLDLVRLHQIIEMKASERLSGAGMPPDSLSSVVSGCLARAYVTRSWNTLQLLSTTFYMNHSFENMIVSFPIYFPSIAKRTGLVDDGGAVACHARLNCLSGRARSTLSGVCMYPLLDDRIAALTKDPLLV